MQRARVVSLEEIKTYPNLSKTKRRETGFQGGCLVASLSLLLGSRFDSKPPDDQFASVHAEAYRTCYSGKVSSDNRTSFSA